MGNDANGGSCMSFENKAVRYIKVIGITLGVCLILPYALMYFHYFFIKWDTEDFREVYRGEGTIQSKGKLMTSSGYEIQFEKFDLSAEFNKTYKIENVPKLGKAAFITLRVLMGVEEFKSLKDQDSELLKSIIAISVENAEGKQLKYISAPMDEFWVEGHPSQPHHPADLFYSTKDKDTVINSELWEKGNLIIRLHFTPGKEKFPKGIKGMLLISCGGFH
jgi:hypothetical protein